MTTRSITHSDTHGAMLKPLLVIVLLISVMRAYFLSINTLDLFVDEIQYWWWSQELAWGYYSKPPMIAVLINLVTSVFGHSVFAIKLGATLVYPLTTYIVYLLGRKLISESVGFWSAILFITLPGVALSSSITSTDVLLFLFWSSATLFFIKSIETNSWIHWLVCGLVCGLGLLTKYNMALFAISALGYMVFWGHINTLKNPRFWVMVVVALSLLAPNFYWNYLNGFPTFSHTAEYVDKKGLYPGKMFSFIFEQAAIIGPVGFIVMWWWLIKGDKPRNLLINFSIPMFVVICLVALQGKYNANWAAPMYIGVIIGVAHFLQNRKKWLVAMLVTNVLLGMLVPLGNPILQAAGIELKNDPFKRVRGWKDWGAEIQTYTNQYPDHQFIADGRTTITEATYYVFGMPNDAIFEWAPTPLIQSHFQLTRPYQGGDKPALFLTRNHAINLEKYFDNVEEIGQVTRHISSVKSDTYYLYKVDGFHGYGY